jgi:ABC-type glycerol-3-phosphate transport system substrate-binding protein
MKSSFALLFSVLLCVLSACGTQGTNDPALDLPEVAAPSAELEPDQTAAQGEYSLAVTQTELPGGLDTLASACPSDGGVYLAGAGSDGVPMLGLWADGAYEPLDFPEGITEIESIFYGDALSVLARAGDAIQILHYEDGGVLTTELNGDLSALGKDLYYAEFGGTAYVMDSNTIAEVKDGQLTRGMEAEAAYLLFTAMQAAQDGLYIVQFSGLDLTTQLLKLNADTFALEPADVGGVGIYGLGTTADGDVLVSCTSDGREFVKTADEAELFDWSEPGIVSPGYTNLYELGDGSWLLFYRGQTSLELLEEKLLPPKTTLTLLTDYPRAELYTIVNDFNRTSEGYRVEVQLLGEGGLTAELLRTQLIAGEGPDIFAFYDRSSLADLGANSFEDLLIYLDADEEYGRDTLVPELLEAMCVQGKLSWLPYSFGISTFTAPSAYLSEPGFSFDEAKQAAAKAGLPLFPGWMTRDILWGWLSDFAVGQYMDLEAGTCSFDSEDYISLLEECAAAASEFGSDSAALYNSLLQFELLQNLIRVSTISSNYGGDYAYVGAPNETTNGSMFSPDLCFTISSASEHKDAAWQLVRSCLSEEHQSALSGGFPASAQALDALIDDAVANGVHYYEYEYELDEADAAKLRGLISETQTAQDAYPAVLNIMAEDAAQFFAGQITAEQAAAYTQDRVSIWLAEQG